MARHRLHERTGLELPSLLQVPSREGFPRLCSHHLVKHTTSPSDHYCVCVLVMVCSSTGEASVPDDYLWLMARAAYKPVIEYCGGERACVVFREPCTQLAMLHAEAVPPRCV